MHYTYNKLKGRIIELYGTQGNFAKKVGISENSLSKKLTLLNGILNGAATAQSPQIRISLKNSNSYSVR